MKINPFSRSSNKGQGRDLSLADSDADDSQIEAEVSKGDRSPSSRISSVMSSTAASLSFAGGSSAARNKVLEGSGHMAAVLGKSSKAKRGSSSRTSKSSKQSSSSHASDVESAFESSRTSSQKSGSEASTRKSGIGATRTKESSTSAKHSEGRESRRRSSSRSTPIKMKRNQIPHSKKYLDDDDNEEDRDEVEELDSRYELDDDAEAEMEEKPKRKSSSRKRRDGSSRHDGGSRRSKRKHRKDRREKRERESDSEPGLRSDVREEGEELELTEFKRQSSYPRRSKYDKDDISDSGSISSREETRLSKRHSTSHSRASRKSHHSHSRRSSSKSRDRKQHREHKTSRHRTKSEAPARRTRSPSPSVEENVPDASSPRGNSNIHRRWPSGKGLGKIFGFGQINNNPDQKASDKPDVKIQRANTAKESSPKQTKSHKTRSFDSEPPVHAKSKKVIEDPVTTKQGAYANLYEFDAFPVIDRVPTAVGYHSDDSKEEYQSVGSATSRYTVDVKKLRKSKIKHAPDEASLSDDDKYAQYLGNAPKPVLSDSSDSCPNVWNSIDEDDSDWYPDEIEIAEEKKETKVAKSDKRKEKRASSHDEENSLGIIYSNATFNVSLDDAKPKRTKDAIVAARSDDSNDIPGRKKSSKVVIKKKEEKETKEMLSDDESYEYAAEQEPTETLKRHDRQRKKSMMEEEDEQSQRLERRKSIQAKEARRKRAKAKVYEENSDSDSSDDESLDEEYLSQLMEKRRRAVTSKGKAQRHSKSKSKKKPNKSLVEKFKIFSKKSRDEGHQVRAHDYDSNSDDSDSELYRYRNEAESIDRVLTNPTITDTSKTDGEDHTPEVIHNMHHTGQQGIKELDEMDDFSAKSDPNNVSCMAFPFNFAALALGGPVVAVSSLWDMYSEKPAPIQAADEDYTVDPTDMVEMQRLKDDERNPDLSFENGKPKVESILDNLNKPQARVLPGIKKKLARTPKAKIDNGKKETRKTNLLGLLRTDEDPRTKKSQERQPSPTFAAPLPRPPPPTNVEPLNEAPVLSYGRNNRSIVADVSNWVLSLDDCRTPQHPPSPTKELPFNTIEFPQADSDQENSRPKSQRRKKLATSSHKPQGFLGIRGKLHRGDSNSKSKKKIRVPVAKSTNQKKKGWFGRKH